MGYAASVNAIEIRTGLNFFPGLEKDHDEAFVEALEGCNSPSLN